MILQNRENLQEFDIDEHWYEHRSEGISAMIRVKNSERWLGQCLESIIKSSIFDEIIITIDGTDRSKEIVENFQAGMIPGCYHMADNISLYDYPFALESDKNGDCFPDSVHDQAYYTNWTMSKTTKKVVCKWDSDMILNENVGYYLSDLALNKKIVRLKGYDVETLGMTQICTIGAPDRCEYSPKIIGYDHYEPRFFHVNKDLYWYQANDLERATQFKEMRCKTLPLCKLERFTYDRAKLYDPLSPMWTMRFNNWMTRNDIYVKEPMYFHTKYCKG